MSYAQENGYIPRTFDDLMSEARVAFNAEFGTTYDEGTWVGTNAYKYWYGLIQQAQGNETRTAEIFTKLQEYIATTNARIQRPSTSLPGIIDSFAANGWVARVRPTEAGTPATGTWTLVSVVATDVANVGGVAFTFTSTPVLETDVEVDVPAASVLASATDVNTTTGALTETAHGFATGDVGRMTTSSVLPTGFALATDYFVIVVNANSYKLASTKAFALAGTPIIPSTTGTGNQTFTLTADTYKASKLAAAVTAHSTIGNIVLATYADNVVTVTAKGSGVAGNFIQFTDQDSTITSSGSGYLAGGTGDGTASAGLVSVCVDVDSTPGAAYNAARLEINTFLKDFIAAGMIFTGSEQDLITLTNGQEFPFSFHLPNYIPMLLRLTLTSSINQDVAIPNDEEIRAVLFANTNARYRLGWNFEPQRYFTQVDAPWAATILLEWSINGGSNYYSTVYSADFDDLLQFDLEDLEVLVDP